jgi:thioester reductase-like protein
MDAVDLVEMLRRRATCEPDRVIYTFLSDDGPSQVLTLRELDRQARAIANGLAQKVAPGARVLLLHPPGLDYIAAFYGCLYAGVVAVPAYPPDRARRQRSLPRILAIVADCAAEVVLTTSSVLADGLGFSDVPSLAGLHVMASDELAVAGNERGYRSPEPRGDALALLQYTSGSTATPKGVMLTHRNMLQNARIQERAWNLSPSSVGVSWLPLYHDLGVITVLIQPIFVGFPTFMMAPTAFLQRPARWLQAISQHRGTFAGGPNFAFDLCARKTSARERDALDLSSWDRAFNGAEPVRADTIEAFSAAFGPRGFRATAMYPCYGLAEANFVSGGLVPGAPVVRDFDKACLERGRVASGVGSKLVGNGALQSGQVVRIVDPETHCACAADVVGEIWLAGESIAKGYFRRDDENRETFAARRQDAAEEGPFFRTGDLGFFHEDELYVAGRLKDLIIVRGLNHYPQDIERTVEQCDPRFRLGCGAAFSIDVDDEERLVVVQECDLPDGVDAAPLFARVRQAIAEQHDLQLHAAVLLRTGSIAKTTSGKLQRRACRAAFLDGTLQTVARWQLDAQPTKPPLSVEARGVARSRSAIAAWLTQTLARSLRVAHSELDPTQPFARYGLDSRTAVELSGELEAWLGRKLSTTLAYQFPTIDTLARHLASDATSATSEAAERGVAPEPIAIVGMACRFPGAENLDAYWALLCEGRDAVVEIPPLRGDLGTRWAGLLGQVDRFDPLFFGISPREATHMDPQQRLLLEVAYEALEDAGLPLSGLAGSATGVFVGITTDDYGRMQAARRDRIDMYTATGTLNCIAANRLSYVFDLRGPSLAIDTACSASLVAVHQACESLWNGESACAIAGGVNLVLSPENSIAQTKLNGLAADGRCKTFDARADGIVRGEGAGMIVCKRLSRALTDGDRIYAVIRGTAVNQDGRSNGLTAPNPEAQKALLRRAYARAGVSPGEVQYVEAHGTGTRLGDPIEAAALGEVLAEGRRAGSVCAIGSVKTNFGHLESAAGIAGVIKVALALDRGAIPPSLHFREPNPHIPFSSLPLAVQTALGAWPDAARIAGVSGFGMGGTNAHAVLAEAPRRAARELRAEDRLYLLPLSARSPEALSALAGRFGEVVAGSELDDICFSASLRREHHAQRAVAVGRSQAELQEALSAFAQGKAHPRIVAGRCRPGESRGPVFVYSGQGAQRSRMGAQLLDAEPTFAAAVARCDEAFAPLVGWSVLEALRSDESKIAETDIVQPMLFALQVGLSALLDSWGVKPAAVVGHSLGEVAAAHVAGALSLAEAARVVVARSRQLLRLRGRGMMALVGLSLAEAHRAVAGYQRDVSVAVSNGPSATVISGEVDAVTAVMAELEKRGVFCRRVATDGAGHGPLVEPLRQPLVDELAGIAPRTGEVPFYSTVTGGRLDGQTLDAEYWGRNIREPVLFSAVLDALVGDGHGTFVELAPHPLLVAPMRETLEAQGTAMPSLRRDGDEPLDLRLMLGALHAAGCPVDFASLVQREARWVTLPSYPWQRQRYWIDESATVLTTGGSHPLLGRHLASASSPSEYWEIDLTASAPAFSEDHRLSGAPLFNSFAYAEMVLAAGRETLGDEPLAVVDLTLHRALWLSDDSAQTVQLVLHPDDNGAAFEVHSRPKSARGSWTRHASGRLERTASSETPLDAAALVDRCDQPIDVAALYAELAARGNELGPRFRGLVNLRRGRGEAFGEVIAPTALSGETDAYRMHPALLDACAQTLLGAHQPQQIFVPVRFGRVRILRAPSERLSVHAIARGPMEGDIFIYDASTGALVAEIVGAQLKALADASPPRSAGEPRFDRAAWLKASPADRASLLTETLSMQAARVLRLAAATVDAQTPLDALGFDSLMAVELKKRVTAHLGVDVPVVAFLRRATIASLAAAARERLESSSPLPASSTLSLEAEVALDPAIRADQTSARAGDPSSIFLTGATGYLGAFLLAELLSATKAKVHCLVRAGDREEGSARLRRELMSYGLWDPMVAHRIVAVPGDLARPRLGQTQDGFSALAETVDAVYHAGALVNFLFPYSEMRSTNVSGTEEVLRLAVENRSKPVHFVSSLSVFFSPRYAGQLVREDEEPGGADAPPPNGYAQSKWVADRVVSLARSRGVQASIYRPVFIGWHSKTGAYNRADFLCRMIRGCIQLGAAPDLEMQMLLAPVDFVARAIVEISRQPAWLGKSFNLVQPSWVSWKDVVSMLRELGRDIAVLPYERWRKRMVESVAQDPGNALRLVQTMFPESARELASLELMSAAQAPIVDRANVDSALSATGLSCPTLDAKLLAVFLAASGRLSNPPTPERRETNRVRSLGD